MESKENGNSRQTAMQRSLEAMTLGEEREARATLVPEDYFARLEDDVVIDILRRVSVDQGKTAIHCLEVCKRWERVGRWSVARLSLQSTRPRHLVPQLSKFECLTHITLKRCCVDQQGWRELSGRCPSLSKLSLRQVTPPLQEADTVIILSGRSSSLKHLEITDSLACQHLPTLNSLTSLLSLDLSHNSLLQSLSPLHALTALASLSLQNCLCLYTAPGLETLTQLRKVNLEGCLSLETPQHPSQLGQMSLLERLSVSSPNINLPIPLGRKLGEYMLIRNDAALLPPLPPLPDLQHLSISHSSRATTLPNLDSLTGRLLSVTLLRFGQLDSITPLAQFHTLQKLKLDICSCLVDIRPLQSLTSLEDLALSKCGVRRMDFTPSLCNLTSIAAENCMNLTLVSFSETFHKLRRLSFRSCDMLQDICSLASLSSLNKLDLWGCSGLRHWDIITATARLSDLTHLNLRSSSRSIFHTSDLFLLPTTLTTLCLDSFQEGLYPVGALPRVQHLAMKRMHGFHLLREMSIAANLSSLVSIHIESCFGLTSAVPLGSLRMLESLSFENCRSVVALPDLANLSFLKSLHLEKCLACVELPRIYALPHLTSLAVCHCWGLKRVPAIDSVPRLTCLDFKGCQSLATFSILCDLPALQRVDLGDCWALRRLPSLSSLPLLHDLRLDGCRALEELPSLTMLTALESIDVRNCPALICLPALDGLPWLREICISDGLVVEGVPPAVVVT